MPTITISSTTGHFCRAERVSSLVQVIQGCPERIARTIVPVSHKGSSRRRHYYQPVLLSEVIHETAARAMQDSHPISSPEHHHHYHHDHHPHHQHHQQQQ
jgi:hypothetical protein